LAGDEGVDHVVAVRELNDLRDDIVLLKELSVFRNKDGQAGYYGRVRDSGLGRSLRERKQRADDNHAEGNCRNKDWMFTHSRASASWDSRLPAPLPAFQDRCPIAADRRILLLYGSRIVQPLTGSDGNPMLAQGGPTDASARDATVSARAAVGLIKICAGRSELAGLTDPKATTRKLLQNRRLRGMP
jgi:hypothetical protein